MDTHIEHQKGSVPASKASERTVPESTEQQGTVPKSGDSPLPSPLPNAADLHKLADIRLFAKLEAASAACTLILETASHQLREIREHQYGEKELAPGGCNRVAGAATSGSEPQNAPRLAERPQQEVPSNGMLGQDAPATRPSPKSKYRPRFNATPVTVIAMRAVTALRDISQLQNKLGHDLINRGVDIEATVYSHRITELVLEYLKNLGIDLLKPPEFAIAAIMRALDLIDEIVQDARKRVNESPVARGMVSKLQRLCAGAQPQAP